MEMVNSLERKKTDISLLRYNAHKEAINYALVLFIVCVSLSKLVIDITGENNIIILFLHFIGGAILFFNNYKSMRPGLMFLIVLDFVCMLIATVIHTSLGSLLRSVNTVLFLLTFGQVVLKKSHLRAVYLLISCFLFFIYVTSTRDGVFYISIFDQEINPNTMGFYIFIITSFTVAALDSYRKRSFEIVSIVLFVIGTALIWLTESRTSMLALALSAFGYLIRNMKMISNDKKYRRLLIFGWAFAFFIMFFYVLLYNMIGEQDLIILGKNLFTGRERVWKSGFEMIASSPIFGVGFDPLYAGKWESGHNSLMGIWKVMGLVPMLVFIYLFSLPCDRYKGKYTVIKSLRITVLALIFIAAFEETFTEQSVYILCLLPLINKVTQDCGVRR